MTKNISDMEPGISLQDSLVKKPTADPILFFELVNELSQSADLLCAITASAKIGIFDLLIIPRVMDDIIGSYPHPAMITPLIRVLTSSGLIIETDGMFSCSDLAAQYFTTSSPYGQIPYLEKLLWHLSEHWLSLSEILRSGPRVYEEQEFFSRWSLPSMAANALTGRLQDVTLAVASLPGFSGFRTMIDLGGGHGLYAMALAQVNPELHAVVFDLPEVISLTRDFIARYNMQDQVSTIGGDFFTDEIGTGYDIILSSSNPSGKALVMLPVIASSLNKRGYFINIQPGDQKSDEDPCNLLEWELWSFSGTDIPKSSWGKKKSFFTPEYHEALINAGLNLVSVTSIPDPYIKGHSVSMVISIKR